MQKQFILLSVFILTFSFSSIAVDKTIDPCFVSFEDATHLNAAAPNKLPKDQAKARKLQTAEGVVKVSRIDGYRVVYKNENKELFVTLIVELSSPKKHEADKTNLLANLYYLNLITEDMETEELIELEFNDYTLYGIGSSTIEEGETLGIFVMFPGNDVIVYFYFQNIDEDDRHFQTLDEFKTERDLFLDEYTLHLSECLAN